VPENPNVLDPDSDFDTINASFDVTRYGGYGETRFRLLSKLVAAAGVRGDYHSYSKKKIVNPRISLQYDFNEFCRLRSSWGLYGQYADPFLHAPGYGNPDLDPMQAIHIIGGFEYKKDYTHARIEAYYKDYDDLVLEDDFVGFANRGYGDAKGIDVFFKYGELFRHKTTGWFSYSYLLSRRLQERDLAESLVYEKSNSPFDITHNLTIVIKHNITTQFNMGLTCRYSTGRPITPIVDAVQDPIYDFYEPIEGPVGSERLPHFIRLDLSVSYYYPFSGQNYMVAYAGISNLADRKNVLDYEYSKDYSTRRPVHSNYARFIYVGASLSFVR